MRAKTPKDTTKITFYADPDVKKHLDRLDTGIKSHTINKLLRLAFKRSGTSIDDQLEQLEARIKKLEHDAQFDGFAINAIRNVMIKHSGGRVANELGDEFIDLFNQTRGMPPRKDWEPDW